jgi:hypothetical protein
VAYHELKAGSPVMIYGLRFIPVDQLDNYYSLSETIKLEKGDDGKERPVSVPSYVDTRGVVDMILFHKDAFVYKFSNPFYEVDKLPGTLFNIFTHIENHPKKRLDILGQFCIGFKFVDTDSAAGKNAQS